MKKKEILQREDFEDVYTEEGIQELVDNDAMMSGEAGFMNGYLEYEEEEEEIID